VRWSGCVSHVAAGAEAEAEVWGPERARFEQEKCNSRMVSRMNGRSEGTGARSSLRRRRTRSQLRQTGSAHLCSASTSRSFRANPV
jgi:hypothetical protein